MKKLGIVGGVAWPSTIDYYRAICRLSVAYHADKAVIGPPPVPEMAIESLNINKSFGLRGGAVTDDASWASYDEYFQNWRSLPAILPTIAFPPSHRESVFLYSASLKRSHRNARGWASKKC